jgi:hypothetical protein
MLIELESLTYELINKIEKIKKYFTLELSSFLSSIPYNSLSS